MAGDPPTDANTVRPRSISLGNDHLKALTTITLVLMDALMLVVAFAVSYEARDFLPFFARPQEQPDPSQYLPTIILHTATVIVMAYFSQLYHLKRAFSRIDQLRSVIGVVTLGALLASGMQEFLLQNTSLETAYPRSLLFYVWFFSVVFTVLGREVHRRLWTQLRKRGVVPRQLADCRRWRLRARHYQPHPQQSRIRLRHRGHRNRAAARRRPAGLPLHRRI